MYAVTTEWLSLKQVAKELGMQYERVLEWPRRKVDPLPMRLIDGNRKQGRVYRGDLNEWILRNSDLVADAA